MGGTYRAFVTAAAISALMTACEGGGGGSSVKTEKANAPVKSVAATSSKSVVLDDFESGTKSANWKDMSGGDDIKCEMEIVGDAKNGKHAAKFSFAGTKGDEKWVDIHYETPWPEKGVAVSFWAKAAKPCKVQVKIEEGLKHQEYAGYIVEANLTTEWKEYTFKLNSFKWLWGHSKQKEHPEAGKIRGVGFGDGDLPATFYLDDFKIICE